MRGCALRGLARVGAHPAAASTTPERSEGAGAERRGGLNGGSAVSVLARVGAHPAAASTTPERSEGAGAERRGGRRVAVRGVWVDEQ